jgi:hypothetical protein
LGPRTVGSLYRANGTDKSSEASLSFLIAGLVSHSSSRLLHPHDRRGIEIVESNSKSWVFELS